MKLLIADSDPLVLKSLEISLSRHDGIELVGLIADGADAVDMCRADNPDVMLLDIRLDGVATTRQIKAHCPNTQVIMLTLFGITPEVQQAMDAGARGCVAKIHGIDNIVNTLYDIMEDL